MTPNPEGFRIKVRARANRPAVGARAAVRAGNGAAVEEHAVAAEPVIRARALLLILYGSNTGDILGMKSREAA